VILTTFSAGLLTGLLLHPAQDENECFSSTRKVAQLAFSIAMNVFIVASLLIRGFRLEQQVDHSHLILLEDVTCYLPLYECSICISDVICDKNGRITAGETDNGKCVYMLLCGHAFHPSCITTWLSLKDTCPNCRVNAVIQLV